MASPPRHRMAHESPTWPRVSVSGGVSTPYLGGALRAAWHERGTASGGSLPARTHHEHMTAAHVAPLNWEGISSCACAMATSCIDDVCAARGRVRGRHQAPHASLRWRWRWWWRWRRRRMRLPYLRVRLQHAARQRGTRVDGEERLMRQVREQQHRRLRRRARAAVACGGTASGRRWRACTHNRTRSPSTTAKNANSRPHGAATCGQMATRSSIRRRTPCGAPSKQGGWG